MGKEDLDDITKRAIFSGFISINDLVSIMAEEEDYLDILPDLWKFYQCDIDFEIDDQDGRGVWIPPWKRKIIDLKRETSQNRLAAWRQLLNRWTGILLDNEEGIYPEHFKWQLQDWKRENLKPIKHLDVYDHDKMHEGTPEDPSARGGSDCIKLDDLKDYIKGIEVNLKIKFPLPKQLFPESQETTSQDVDSSSKYMLRKQGDLWTITFEGKTVPVKGKGWDYIKVLLQSPNDGFKVLDLVTIAEKRVVDSRSDLPGNMTKANLEEMNLSVVSDLGNAGPAYHKKAYAEYKKEYEKIEREVNYPAAELRGIKTQNLIVHGAGILCTNV